jgi:hypothetical protein
MAVVDNILKEVYEDKLRDQLQSDVLTLRRVEKTSEGVSEDVGGKYVRFPIRTSRNHGMGARREYEALPMARTQGYASAQVNLAYLYGAIQLTGQTFELAERNPQAFVSALQAEVNGLKEGLAKDMNRQTYGTSLGELGVAVTGSTTTLVMLNENALYFEQDMSINIWDASGAAFIADGTGNTEFIISSVVPGATSTTITFTPTAATAVAVGDSARRNGSSIDATTGKELVGLKQIVNSTGTLFNIDPSVTTIWKSSVDSNSGTNRALTEGRMIQMVDKLRISGARPSVIFTSLGVRRSYFNLLSQQREFVNTKTFTGGFEGLAFAGAGGEIPMIEDVDCQANRMYFVSEKELKLYQAGDWSFMNRDGSNWQRIVGQTGGVINYFDAYTSMMFKYCQLGTHRRNAHGLISDLTEG